MEGMIESKPSVRFEVERVIGISSDGSYQVQWAPAWVSKFHLVGCEHLIQEFLEQQHFDRDVEKSDHPELELTPHMSSSVLTTIENNFQTFGEREELYTLSATDEICSPSLPNPLSEISINHISTATVNQHETNNEIDIKNEVDSLIKVDETLSNSPNVDDDEHDSSQWNQDSGIVDEYCDLPTFSNVTPSHMQSTYWKTSELDSLHSHPRTSCTLKKQVCLTCGKRFRDKTDLKRHTRTHTGYKPHTCGHCGKAFSLKQNLHKHLETHDYKQYRCMHCEKVYTNRVSLMKHIRTHGEGRVEGMPLLPLDTDGK